MAAFEQRPRNAVRGQPTGKPLGFESPTFEDAVSCVDVGDEAILDGRPVVPKELEHVGVIGVLVYSIAAAAAIYRPRRSALGKSIFSSIAGSKRSRASISVSQ